MLPIHIVTLNTHFNGLGVVAGSVSIPAIPTIFAIFPSPASGSVPSSTPVAMDFATGGGLSLRLRFLQRKI